jgi:hypothetical protein
MATVPSAAATFSCTRGQYCSQRDGETPYVGIKRQCHGLRERSRLSPDNAGIVFHSGRWRIATIRARLPWSLLARASFGCSC